MRLIDTLQLSTRMFKTRKMRTFLTILGIGIGIGAILFLVSLGDGLRRTLIARITSSDALLSLDVLQSEKTALVLDQHIMDTIKTFPEVKEVAPMESMRGQATYGEATADAVINIASASFLKLSNFRVVAGTAVFNQDKREVIISKAMTRVFNIENPQDIIASDVYISFLTVRTSEDGLDSLELVDQKEAFKIVGVTDDESSSVVYFPIDRVIDLTVDSFSQFKVRVNDTKDLDPVRNKILDMGFVVAALSDIVDQANKIFRILQIILAVFGIVALAISAIGMFNTMTIALMERTQEVGIMKSLGAASGDIMLMFVTEASVMGFLGGIVGITVGWVGGKIFNLILNLLSKNFGGGQSLDIFYTPSWFVITVVIFSAVVGFLTGLWPARRAAHLNPLEAVRYK